MTKAKKQKNKTEKVLTLLARKDILLSDKRIAKDVGCTVSLVNKLRNSSGFENQLPSGFKPQGRSDDWVADFAYRMTKDGTATSVNRAGVDPNAWTRTGILNQAEQYVTKDRAATHGNMEDNFREIAELWTQYTERTFSSLDVAVMMTLLKIARLKSNPDNADNWIDACGYLACGGELATQKDHK